MMGLIRDLYSWFALNLTVGWLAILAGLLTGAGVGLLFHDEDWLGGYGSWRRRMLRLAHVAMVGTGLLNLTFSLTARTIPFTELRLAASQLIMASALLVTGAVLMPLVCLLSAWRKGMRHLFFIPVTCLVVAVACLLLALPASLAPSLFEDVP
jgi:hypothetical protein